MTAGKGFIALVALVLPRRPVQAMFACLLFGFLDAVAIRMQGVELIGFAVPVTLSNAHPNRDSAGGLCWPCSTTQSGRCALHEGALNE